jgi:drug/metabolite transporter (DMT)-like permease
MTTELWAIGLVVLGTMINASAPILFKLGSKNFTMHPLKLLRNPLPLLTNWRVILGCFLYTVSAFLFIPALRGGELSVLYPVISLNYVWVAFLSMIILKERMNFLKWLGIIIIILSVTLIGIGST